MSVSFLPHLAYLASQTGKNVKFPDEKRNFAVFEEARISEISSHKEKALPYLSTILKNSKSDAQICEALYIVDKICDYAPEVVAKSYGVMSKFNSSDNPNIQVLLAGIYRKTQIPDAYGALLRMLDNARKNPPLYFDPAEEIGGAVLEYLRNYSSKDGYKNLP